MRVVIVPPPLFSREHHERAGVGVYPPLGALCVATVAIEHGHDVRICDLAVARRRGLLPPRSQWYEAAADYILSHAPDLVGFGSVCSSFPTSVLVCQAMKRRRPSVTTVFGGPHASLVYRDLLLEIPAIDFVLTGEADFSFTELLGRLENRTEDPVQGLAKRQGGDVVHEPHRPPVCLDTLPIPDFGLWPLEEAIENCWCEPVIPIDAGRGCPYACTFCSTSRFFGRQFRMKSPARIATEMRQLYGRYGCAWFALTSDLFTAKRRVVSDVCEAIAGSGIPAVRWTCSARLDTVDRNLLETMKHSGCFGLFFGVETGSPRMQRIVGKNLDLGRLGEIVADCVDLDFEVGISTIVGFPEEDWHDIEATVDILLRYCGIEQVHPMVYILSPQPGTPITEEYSQQLLYDEWLSDMCGFNGATPTSDERFVRQHLSLCPEFCYFPNERVNRQELTQLTEYVSLLLNVIPGLAAYLPRACDSLLSVFREWKLATVRAGLPLPDGNGCFSRTTSQRRARYLAILLDVLGADYCDTAIASAFLSYFRAMIDALTPRHGEEFGGDYDSDKLTLDPGRALPMSTRPLLASACGFADLDHDVHETIVRRRESGQWRWPREKVVSYLFVNENSDVTITRVARATNFVARRCDGKHSIRDLLALVDCLEDPETSRLRALLGTRRLTAGILTRLGRSAGLATA